MNNRKIPQAGEFYRHFKGNLYQIITIATLEANGELLVIYQALYNSFGIFARPLDEFLSETDMSKYPNAKQKYRFELITLASDLNKNEQNTKSDVTLINNASEKEIEIPEITVNELEAVGNPDLMNFLDAETYEEKLALFMGMRKRMTDRLINDIAVSLDVVVEENDLDSRFDSIRVCLETMAKYECNRFR